MSYVGTAIVLAILALGGFAYMKWQASVEQADKLAASKSKTVKRAQAAARDKTPAVRQRAAGFGRR